MPDTPTPATRDGIPVLDGFIERRTAGVSGPPAMLLRIWCRWCCTWHTHGLGTGAPGDYTHRVQHCYARDSEYQQHGYWVHITDTRFGRVRGTVRAASVAQRSAIRSGRISPAVQRLRGQASPAPSA